MTDDSAPPSSGMFATPRSAERVLQGKEVFKRVGLSEATVWRLRRQGKFPKPIRLSGSRIGWPEKEIEDWIAARPRA